jgi:thioredoxin reductase
MMFLHALAAKRKELKEAGDVEGIANLPVATVFEKASAPGGVWRSNRNDDGGDSSNGSTNMYEGLWINGHKDGMEFFDYTYKDHFKTPQPVYLPRQHILEYLLARVTQHENIFEHVNFNTEVQSVVYDDHAEQFVIRSKNDTGLESVQCFDKCIWAAGLNGKPKMIKDTVDKLSNFKGQIVHSAEMSKLATDDTNAVKGKHIVMVGCNYSAEDLALQCVKLGADRISILSRYGYGSACYMGAWPEDKVDIIWYSEIGGVKDSDEKGSTLLLNSLDEEYPASCGELEDVSIVIFCTGYIENHHFLAKNLNPFGVKKKWCLEDIGLDASSWRMADHPFSKMMGHVEPSNCFETDDVTYDGLLMSNPNMMIIHTLSDYDLLEIDVLARSCLLFITGERQVPTEEEMKQRERHDLIRKMNDFEERQEIDKIFKEAADAIAIPDNYGTAEDYYGSDEFIALYPALYSLKIRMLARLMKDTKYPLQLGDIDHLNKVGMELMRMMGTDVANHYLLASCDEETKRWKTFRDGDPSPFRSLITGMGSVPLKGKWMEIDDDGNPPAPAMRTENSMM